MALPFAVVSNMPYSQELMPMVLQRAPQKGLSLEDEDQEEESVLQMKWMFEPLHLLWACVQISGHSSGILGRQAPP